ncbi:MAG: hypothetical protein KGI60_00465 [Patescibacteria group bacterium]|nr:hypothetical protein [Patescibacteria group bacterium]
MAKQANPWEDLAEEALVELVAEGALKGFLRNRQSDWLDCEGIDFLLFLNNGSSLTIQVKSAHGNLKHKIKEHLRKHPFVRSILFVLLPEQPENSVERQKAIALVKKDISRLIAPYR